MPQELDEIEIDVPNPDDDGGSEFRLVPKGKDDTDNEEYIALRKQRRHDQEAVETMAKSADGHKEKYDEMKKALQEYETQAEMLSDKDRTSKKRKILRDLKPFRSGKGSKFIFGMLKNIKQEKDQLKKYQAAYRKMMNAMEESIDKEKSANAQFKRDCDAFYDDVDSDEE